MRKMEDGKSVTYVIGEKSYWDVGKYSSMCMIGKSEFVDLLIERYAERLAEEETKEKNKK